MIEIETQQPAASSKKKKGFVWGGLIVVVLAALIIVVPRLSFFQPPVDGRPDPLPPGKFITKEEPPVESPREISDAKPPLTTTDTTSAETIKNLQAQIVALQNQNNQSQPSARKWVAAAVAFWDLRDAAKNGHSFAPQLATLRASADDDVNLLEQARKLEPYADEKILTFMQLLEKLQKEEATLSPSVEETNQSFWGRLKIVFRPLISVHPLHDTSYIALEKSLDDEDGARALETFKDLSLATQTKLSLWHTELEKRVALDAALHELTALFTAPPSQGLTP